MVITSDELEFVNVVTSSLTQDPCGAVRASYLQGVEGRSGKPALILPYAPFMLTNSGDDYMNTLMDVSGGAPCFGTIATDDSVDFSTCYTIYNGEYYPDRMVMSLIYGEIKPKFYVANISLDKVLEKSAVITKSEGHVIIEVNGRPVIEYFSDLGLTESIETRYAMTSLPFLIDYNDNTPKVSKLFINLTPERHALCAGAVPEGSKMNVATNDKDDILFTTGQAIGEILKDAENASGLLMYSCVSRSMSMGSDQFGEVDHINSLINGKLPFFMAYSGGEFCPTTVADGKAINRFHNNAFVACLF
jgi:hypothetical protein